MPEPSNLGGQPALFIISFKRSLLLKISIIGLPLQLCFGALCVSLSLASNCSSDFLPEGVCRHCTKKLIKLIFPFAQFLMNKWCSYLFICFLIITPVPHILVSCVPTMLLWWCYCCLHSAGNIFLDRRQVQYSIFIKVICTFFSFSEPHICTSVDS